mmetsp:Transcript_7174/g.22638  ORF Transcript_7174/g.22638 Transcript_7174/m.22638 type:complete len:340 (+) Transcript_7174:1058-2077(+)
MAWRPFSLERLGGAVRRTLRARAQRLCLGLAPRTQRRCDEQRGERARADARGKRGRPAALRRGGVLEHTRLHVLAHEPAGGPRERGQPADHLKVAADAERLLEHGEVGVKIDEVQRQLARVVVRDKVAIERDRRGEAGEVKGLFQSGRRAGRDRHLEAIGRRKRRPLGRERDGEGRRRAHGDLQPVDLDRDHLGGHHGQVLLRVDEQRADRRDRKRERVREVVVGRGARDRHVERELAARPRLLLFAQLDRMAIERALDVKLGEVIVERQDRVAVLTRRAGAAHVRCGPATGLRGRGQSGENEGAHFAAPTPAFVPCCHASTDVTLSRVSRPSGSRARW